MSVPRDHHFIPAFFLEQWSGQNGKLIEYTIKHGKLIAKPVGSNATGYERDLYAFPDLPPDVVQYVEQVFWDYADRTASQALRLHLGSNELQWTPELHSAWSRFVVGVHLRHPDAMPELRAAGADRRERLGDSGSLHAACVALADVGEQLVPDGRIEDMPAQFAVKTESVVKIETEDLNDQFRQVVKTLRAQYLEIPIKLRT